MGRVDFAYGGSLKKIKKYIKNKGDIMGLSGKGFSFLGMMAFRCLAVGLAMGVIVLISPAVDGKDQGYRVTCQNMDDVMMGLNDGRSRGLCEDAMNACQSQMQLEKLSDKDPLKTQINAFLPQRLNETLALCNLGLFYYNPDSYEALRK